MTGKCGNFDTEDL